MDYILNKNVRQDKILRKSFFQLAKDTFDISFEEWYEKGFWTDKYIPYSIIDNNKVISNVSINIMNIEYNKIVKKYIQIGTVMTHKDYRNKGLSKYLLNTILEAYKNKVDGIYLFANDTVLNFYPKFNFIKENEYEYYINVKKANSENFRKLDINKHEDIKILKQCYEKSNPFSKVNSINNFEFLMFYCTSIVKDYIYYCEKYNLVCIIDNKEDIICYDIFGNNHNLTLENILANFVIEEEQKVILGFTPQDNINYQLKKLDNDDDTLFILKDKENIFYKNKIRFPILSHG